MDGPGGDSGQVDNLTRLRSRNHSLKVCVFATFAGPFLTFGGALDATLLLLLLFLSAGTFSWAFIHAFYLCAWDDISDAVENRDAVKSKLMTGSGAPASNVPDPAMGASKQNAIARRLDVYQRLRPRPAPPPLFRSRLPPPKLDSRGLASFTLMFRPLSSESLN